MRGPTGPVRAYMATAGTTGAVLALVALVAPAPSPWWLYVAAWALTLLVAPPVVRWTCGPTGGQPVGNLGTTWGEHPNRPQARRPLGTTRPPSTPRPQVRPQPPTGRAPRKTAPSPGISTYPQAPTTTATRMKHPRDRWQEAPTQPRRRREPTLPGLVLQLVTFGALALVGGSCILVATFRALDALVALVAGWLA